MRRTCAVGIVVLVMLGALTGLAAPADALSSSLTIITLGRDGQQIATQPALYQTSTSDLRYVESGRAVRTAAGTYDVLVNIFQSSDGTDTVGAAQVHVSGRTTVVIDARRGRAIRADLSPAAPDGYTQTFQMTLCVGSWPVVLGGTDGTVFYSIPSRVPAVDSAFGVTWQPPDDSSQRPRYLAAAADLHGLPGGGTRTFRQSTLATVRVHAQSGPVLGSARVDLETESADGCRDSINTVSATLPLPSSFALHIPAGSWSIDEQARDAQSGGWNHFAAGRHYNVTLNQAVWGPVGQLPYTWSGHNLYVNMPTMIADPVLTTGAYTRAVWTLRTGGRTILHRIENSQGMTLSPVLPRSGWYTLSASATRLRAVPGALSTRALLGLRFYADPDRLAQVRDYLPQFRPLGLDTYDRAAPTSTTVVDLAMHRDAPEESTVTQLPDAVKQVQVLASNDDGKSWHRVPVAHLRAGWIARVRNGASGYTSLRTTVTDTHGDSSTITVIRAYGIG